MADNTSDEETRHSARSREKFARPAGGPEAEGAGVTQGDGGAYLPPPGRGANIMAPDGTGIVPHDDGGNVRAPVVHHDNMQPYGDAPAAYRSCFTKVAQRHCKSKTIHLLRLIVSIVLLLSIGRICQVTCSITIAILLLIMIATLSLMIYFLVKAQQANQLRPVIPISTSEVFSLKESIKNYNLSLYSEKVCIDNMDKIINGIAVYLKHGRCSDISTTRKPRKINHSFSNHNSTHKPLNFNWMINSTFRVNLTMTGNGTFTIYATTSDPKEETRHVCDSPPEHYAAKLIFPPTSTSSHKVNCNGTEGNYTCSTEHVKIHHSKRYYMCFF